MQYTCMFCHCPVTEENMLLFRNMPLKKKGRDLVADKACEEQWNQAIVEEAKETNTEIFNVLLS